MTSRDSISEFGSLIEEAFAFLTDDGAFAGPERQADGAFYYSPAFSVEVRLDPRERAVVTLLSGMVDDQHLRAELSCLYAAADLGPVQHVRRTARTGHSMKRSVASQAAALRLLLPIITGSARSRLLKACHAR